MSFQGMIHSRVYFLLSQDNKPLGIVSENREKEALEWKAKRQGREVLPLEELLDLPEERN